ncbi:hypothetical protein SAMN05216174_10444 [Actinokineospora iranica]|uniref:Uncharacterized protein n=2 Tax=Actinokineospora iranica TaxID=1271860 RepID=A0A1G6P1U5_9PSEU|nr:hypothetical protein SAMN05216174_10444 [Actinokineospora iranica]
MTDFQIAWVSPAEPREPVNYVRTGPDTAMPIRFRASIALAVPDAAVTIEVFTGADMRPRINELVIRSSVQKPITTSVLRQVLVDQLLRAAVKEAEVPVDSLSAGTVLGTQPVPATGKADEDASIAARIYREAVASGNPAPAMAVASSMGRSRAQVARYIRKARQMGLLPEL